MHFKKTKETTAIGPCSARRARRWSRRACRPPSAPAARRRPPSGSTAARAPAAASRPRPRPRPRAALPREREVGELRVVWFT